MHHSGTRQRIIETADLLFYQHGFEHTSFADIAAAVQISRGNFYHHFKTKDEILDAVISRRIANTESMLNRWEEEGDTPKERIRSFIHILIMNKTKIKQFGCPIGSLCTELAKLDHIAKSRANTLFTLFRRWLTGQFELLGRKKDAEQLAMHLLMRSQGVAVLASSFHDEKFIQQEVEDMCAWLETQTEQQ
ncbi:MAG: TetR/AcrR family transcriptional regulator [Gammaproteobacteria bacterium]|nr:TetR/AcrR family transcriptional regulator [Gammaproteobacteria bacterium]